MTLEEKCRALELELAEEKKANHRYFLIASLCQTIANHDVGEKLDNPPISHPVIDAVLQLQAERDLALRPEVEPTDSEVVRQIRNDVINECADVCTATSSDFEVQRCRDAILALVSPQKATE